MRRTSQNDESTKVRFRIMEVEVEGGSPAVIESLRSMAGAFSRQKAPPPRPLAAASADKVEEAETQAELDFGDATPEPVMAEGSAKAQRARPARKPAQAPPLIKDLRLEDGTTPFTDFYTQLGAPDEHSMKCLAVAYWLKNRRNPSISAITPSHTFTIYRLMGWVGPTDPASPLVDSTRKTQWFTKEESGFSITNVGETVIDKLLSKKK